VATVHALVHSIADACAVAWVALTRSHPDDIGIGLEDGDGADGRRVLVIEVAEPT
jgi:hypothetical protein